MKEVTQRPVVFLAFANDRDSAAQYLRNLPEELRQVRDRLEGAQTAGRCELVIRSNTTLAEILDVFQDARYRDRIALFHYGGHAGSFSLLLESVTGAPVVAHTAGFAGFIGQQDGLRLVFLNGCSTQAQVDDLLAAGVSAVIATSTAVDDAVATELASRFYAGLSGGATVSEAYSEAVGAVRTARGDAPRDVVRRTPDGDPETWPWDLFVRDGAEEVREWRLPDPELSTRRNVLRQVLAWTFGLVAIAFAVLLTTSFLLSWPRPIDFYFPGDPATAITVEGGVYDEGGAPIGGAQITIDAHPFRALTQSDGKFLGELDNVELNEIITLRVTRDGYEFYSTSRQLRDSTARFDTIRLSKSIQ